MDGGQDVVVGRQGIHGSDGLIGYELLFRSLVSRAAKRLTGDEMTADVIFTAMSIGLDTLVGDRLVFCNADRGLLTGQPAIMLPADRTVIEVVETLTIDNELIAGVQALVEAGYKIALDDFIWGTGHEVLLPLASIVKIDLQLTHESELPAVVEKCRQYPVIMLAEKVEDAASIPALRELGFEYFQGYALDRPVVVQGRVLAANEVNSLQVAMDVLRGDPDIDELETMLRRDPALAHQIMRLASFGRAGETGRRIGSLRDALVMAGTRNVQRWLAVLLARPKGSGASADFGAVLMRARACELLATAHRMPRASLAFTAGLLSGLEEVLEVDMSVISEQLSLSDELRDAAFGGPSELGALVQDVTDYRYHVGASRGRTRDQLSELAWRSGVPLDDFDNCFATAFSWAMDCSRAMSEASA